LVLGEKGGTKRLARIKKIETTGRQEGGWFLPLRGLDLIG
jgi:hypothetical protein